MIKKTAKVPIIAISEAEFDSGTNKIAFKRTASQKTASYYQANSNKLDVKSLLDMVAKDYDISNNPHDYIFEAVRAVTADVPNENGDAFPKEELLRFDHRLGKAVYQTFVGKPHHINHRADNPKTSRGVVLDASYNDLSEPMASCPSCGHHTASAEGRDKSGIGCVKCGTTVKDEFVELLLAVDTKKDPTFADGVKTGSLDSLSMGCFVPGTQVQMADGTTKSIELVRSGDFVRTHNGNIAEVSDLSVRDFSDEIITIKVAGQGDITLTPNHPVWVINQETGVGEWIHAAHIISGMWVLSPKINSLDIDVDLGIARLAGYFVSEGNFIKGYNKSSIGSRVGLEFTFNISETGYAAEVQSLINGLGYDSHRYERKDRNTITVKSYRCEPLASKMFELVGEHAHSKVLSEEILNWNKDAQMAFVGAWLNGDGHSVEYGNTSRSVFVTVSRDLASQLSQILINNDISNRVQIRNNASGFGSDRPAYDIVISGDAQVRLATVSNKIKRTFRGTDALLQSRNMEAGVARLVKKVTRSQYDGPVHNFEVLHEDHSYIAGGIAAHNCEAGYTDCSICDNRARTVSQFCTHIKSGNKKKQFKTASGMKMSYEKCGEVVFTEISRVDQPADPTAKQREVFQVNALPLNVESEMLMMSAKIAKLEGLVKAAQMENTGVEAQLVDDVSPQVPFKNIAESIKWAETSIHKLKAEVHSLTAEKSRKHKEASDVGRPFYAWENAAFDMQIKANRQYISRLEDYVAKAREMQASGQPWEKGLTRQMSRFFASKEAQALDEIKDQAQDALEPLKVIHPEVAPLIDQLSGDGDVPGPMSIGDYVKEKEESGDSAVTPAEMGMKLEDGDLPVSITAKAFDDRILSDLDMLIDSVKENNVDTDVAIFKFANSYKDLEATVTKTGNIKVHNKHGTLFVIRPETKPADKTAAEKMAADVLTHIADHGVVSTVEKYPTVLGPKMAQVLQHHMEDFAGGRDEGDKDGMPEGGDDDLADKRGKPAKSLVGEETTDMKDEGHDKRDLSNADVLEEHQPDHDEALPAGFKPAAEDEHSDMADGHGKPAKSVLSDITVDFKDKQPKTAQMGAPPSDMPVAAAGDMCANEMCAAAGGKAGAMECKCPPGCDCQCSCTCAAEKKAQDAGGLTMAPSAQADAAPAGGMPAMAEKSAALSKYTSRLERLYKSRLEKTQADAAKKVADAQKDAVAKVSDKFLRALKLAAKRQALNLEFSPLKAVLCDTLTSQLDLDADSFYPGMDASTATHLIEAASDNGFDQFVESIVKRASDFMSMNDESLTALESDVKNLRPAMLTVTASKVRTAAARDDVRTAAVEGNLVVAPSPTSETISNGGNRDNIRSALGSTKVRRTSQALLKGN